MPLYRKLRNHRRFLDSIRGCQSVSVFWNSTKWKFFAHSPNDLSLSEPNDPKKIILGSEKPDHCRSHLGDVR